MNKKIIKLYDPKIGKNIHQYKIPILIVSVDINKIIVSNKVSFA